jgi:Ca-activated chloride channel family protein
MRSTVAVVACALSAFVLAPALAGSAVLRQQSQTTIRSEVSLVNVVFNATDRSGKTVSGMKADDFLVFEDGKPQQVEYFSDWTRGTEVPLTMALLIDTSGSVKSKLEYETRTAAEFLKTMLRPGTDLALIIQFDSDVNLVQDFTDDLGRLTAALDSLRAGNSTSLYDAVFLAVDEKLKAETGRKVIIAITDGTDTSSKLKEKDAIEAAQGSEVLIYGIAVRGDAFDSFGVLKKFAEETGGRFFSPRARQEEIHDAFRAIGEDLKGQYNLAYRSTNLQHDGKFREINLRCKVPGVRIRARKGYYAPKGK